jgi:predicted nucleic-acid-binding protein
VRAIDTNVVVRFLTGDDKAQARKARAVIEAGDIFIATTVLLESEWVLRSGYGFASDRIAAALRGLAGLSAVTIEEPERLARALDWMGEDMDFADALHLAKAQGCRAFLSFDRGFIKAVSGCSPIPVMVPG